MASANQYRITRKSLRAPDEFQTLTTQAVDWARANQSLVVTVVSAIVAVAAVVVGVNWYSARQADAAAVRLQAAQVLFDGKKYADAATEFSAVAAAYPRTPSGRLAALYRAHALAEQPDPAAAATAYSEYLASSPPTDYLRQQALVGLGHASEATNALDAARDAYRQATEIPGPFRARAQLDLARLEEAAGHADQAQALYAEAAKSPGLDSETRQAIVSRLPPSARPAVPESPTVDDAGE